jgi:hypothetical protein
MEPFSFRCHEDTSPRTFFTRLHFFRLRPLLYHRDTIRTFLDLAATVNVPPACDLPPVELSPYQQDA